MLNVEEQLLKELERGVRVGRSAGLEIIYQANVLVARVDCHTLRDDQAIAGAAVLVLKRTGLYGQIFCQQSDSNTKLDC